MIRFLSGYTSSIPLNHPRIAYENYSATITGTAGQTYTPDVMGGEYTYDRWDPSGGGNATFDLGASLPISCISIAAHTLNGSTVTLEWSTDDVSYTTLHSAAETNDTPLMFVFTQVNARYIKLTITGGEVGVVFIGRVLELYRGIYAGHTPITLSRTTVKNLNRSIQGQFLGATIVRTGLSSSYQASNIPLDWYEANIEPLSQHARTKPFFVAWNPSEHPTHTAYGYAQGDIKPTLSGTINFCDFGFDLDAYQPV